MMDVSLNLRICRTSRRIAKIWMNLSATFYRVNSLYQTHQFIEQRDLKSVSLLSLLMSLPLRMLSLWLLLFFETSSHSVSAPSKLPWGLDKSDELKKLMGYKNPNKMNGDSSASDEEIPAVGYAAGGAAAARAEARSQTQKSNASSKDALIAELSDDVAACLQRDLNRKCGATKKQPGHGLFLWEILGQYLPLHIRICLWIFICASAFVFVNVIVRHYIMGYKKNYRKSNFTRGKQVCRYTRPPVALPASWYSPTPFTVRGAVRGVHGRPGRPLINVTTNANRNASWFARGDAEALEFLAN